MPTVSGEVYAELDFDLSDYEDEIISEYCNGDNCLIDSTLKSELKEYVEEMYKQLYSIPECNKKIKTIEEIYDDLYNMIRE